MRDRLRATGVTGEARVVLRDAKIVESRLAVQGGLRGAFTTEQGYRYDANIEVEIQLRDAGGVQRAFAKAQASRSRTTAAPAKMIASMVTLLRMPMTLANHAEAALGLKAMRVARLTDGGRGPTLRETKSSISVWMIRCM